MKSYSELEVIQILSKNPNKQFQCNYPHGVVVGIIEDGVYGYLTGFVGEPYEIIPDMLYEKKFTDLDDVGEHYYLIQ